MVRFKVRYLLGEVLGEGLLAGEQGFAAAAELKVATLVRAIKDSVQVNFGDHGMAMILSWFSVKYYNPRTGLFIVRVARDHVRMMWGALTFITLIANVPCVLTVIHCGGTLRSCQKAAVSHSRVQLKVLHRSQKASEALQQELAELDALIKEETEEIE